tara:strand:- start:55 stop:1272 length:1218 start_codon:yes stop_codon:yes gene_type:complete
MANTPALRANTWTLDQWYDQAVAGTQGEFVENFTMFMWGTGTEGRLAQNNNTSYSSPRQIPGETWSSKTGGSNTLGNPGGCGALRTDGTAWSWGKNEHGQLGHNNRTDYSSPRQVGTDTIWRSCQLGDRNGIWSKTDGTLWMTGSNTYGSLGQNVGGNPGNRSSPVQVGSGTDWSENVWTAEQGRAGAVKTDGTLWQWGYSDNGTIGNNTNQNSGQDRYSSPVQVPGTTWATTLGNTAFTGQNFVMIKSDNTMWAWGYNQWGALGQNKTNNSSPKGGRSSPVQIPGSWKLGSLGGGRNMMAVKTDGTLWVWGRDYNGSFAQNAPPQPASSPVQVGTDTNWKLARGSEDGQNLAIKTDGTLWGWGTNDPGGLGLNNKTQYSSPVQIPGNWGQVIAFTGWTQAFKNT